jgi:hypothetical protein
LVGQRLGAAAAGVDDDQHGAWRQIRCGGSDEVDRILARLCGGVEHHHAFVGEQ